MTPTPPVYRHRHAGDRALPLEPKQLGSRRREGRAARHLGGHELLRSSFSCLLISPVGSAAAKSSVS